MTCASHSQEHITAHGSPFLQPLSGWTGLLQLKHTPVRLMEFSGLVLGLCFFGNLVPVCSVNVLIVSIYLPPPCLPPRFLFWPLHLSSTRWCVLLCELTGMWWSLHFLWFHACPLCWLGHHVHTTNAPVLCGVQPGEWNSSAGRNKIQRLQPMAHLSRILPKNPRCLYRTRKCTEQSPHCDGS